MHAGLYTDSSPTRKADSALGIRQGECRWNKSLQQGQGEAVLMFTSGCSHMQLLCPGLAGMPSATAKRALCR